MSKTASSERGNRGNTAFLLASAFCIFGFNTVATTATPGFVASLGGNAFLAGLQNSVFILTAIALRFVFGPIADRRGSRFMMIVGALGFLLPCPLLAFCTRFEEVLLLRILQGVGLAAYLPCASAAMTTLAPAGRLGTRLGILRFTTTLAAMIGPALLFPLAISAGYPTFFLVLAALALAGLLLLIPLRAGDERSCGRDGGAGGEGNASERSDDVDGRSGGDTTGANVAATCGSGGADTSGGSSTHLPWRALRPHLALFVFPFALATAYGMLLNFGAMLVGTFHPQVNAGLIFTSLSLGGLVGSLAAGRSFDAFGIGRTLTACLLAIAAGFLLDCLGVRQIPVLFGGAALIGMGYFGGIAVLVAEVGARLLAARGQALSLQQSCLDLGIACGGLLSGAMLDFGFPITRIMFLFAALMLVMTGIWLFAMRAPTYHTNRI